MISMSDFSYRFKGNEDYSLRNINIEIKDGEFIVITGPSGCGKSTLALALGGYLFSQFEGEYQGQIRIDELNIPKSNIYDIADKVGLVQQNPEAQFCTLTVIDEVSFGLENRCIPREEIKRRVDWSLEVVGASSLLYREIASLSGGEKQKIAIAAMMASKPEILIFDEPTSNLDPAATREIFDVISDLRTKSNITVIVIEHKTAFLAAFQPRVIHMENGYIQRYDSAATLNPFHKGWIPQNHTSNHHHKDQKPVIKVNHLHASYYEKKVLYDINLTFFPGDLVSIMGDNGSGKSTLIRNIMGFVQPSQGMIEIFNEPIEVSPFHKRAKSMGLVFQNPEHQLFSNSVWEEAVFAPKNFNTYNKKVTEKTENLLRKAGLKKYKNRHPYRLSYGEKRRLNLISVLTYTPKCLLLDEILIGQDYKNALFLMELLKDTVENRGVVLMVNHNPDISYQFANRLIFFEEGKVTIDAPIQEAFELLAKVGKTSYLPTGFITSKRVS
jgi:energy-coupling factor transport system ATP-binding protein